jgi:transposase
MKVKNQVKLKPEEQKKLEQLISKGVEKVRKITRCRILLIANEGKPDSHIMETLRVARNTVRTVRVRYVKEGLEAAINERPRPGAPLRFNGKQKAKITALACSNPPEGKSRWTLRLLADKIVELDISESICFKTVANILKKTKLSLT